MIPEKLIRVERHGVQVWAHACMDELRRTECLCLNCGNLGKCATAKRGYELCKESNIAFAVTRCPEFDNGH